MTLYRTDIATGNEIQIVVEGNQLEIMMFIGDYEGDDLGNELLKQSFVTGHTETGVVIYAK